MNDAESESGAEGQTLSARIHQSISEIDPAHWRNAWQDDNPFVRYEFLKALEDSGSASPESGWFPHHIALYRQEQLIAVLPQYLKFHSRGEFVFDWSWAHAYEQHGLEYYPKLVSAIPFIPSQGPRLGVCQGENARQVVEHVLTLVDTLLQQQGWSGWHLLFPDPTLAQRLRDVAGGRLLERTDVQFHWMNQDYDDFDDFLAGLKSSRRKNLRKERRRVQSADVKIERICGPEIGDADWDTFYQCYCHTFLKRSGSQGYLNRAFFDQIRQTMPEQLMLVVARRSGQAIASALFLQDGAQLYGRYWGAMEEVHSLHFECCFYQGIEFCIERGLQRFDPGTQGEHKLLRGFAPVEVRSFHRLADARFHGAVERYLGRERESVEHYRDEATQFLPYRNDD